MKVFSTKNFAKLVNCMSQQNCEIVFSTLDGLSRSDFYLILDKIEAGYYKNELREINGLAVIARMYIEDYCFIEKEEGVAEVTEKDFIDRVKEMNLEIKCFDKNNLECSFRTSTVKPGVSLKTDPCLIFKHGDYKRYLGEIGKPTTLKDENGNELNVGDIVIVFSKKENSQVGTAFTSVVIEDDDNFTLYGCGTPLKKEIEGQQVKYLKAIDYRKVGTDFRLMLDDDSIMEYHNNIAGTMFVNKEKLN